jgi:hypothetical protein
MQLPSFSFCVVLVVLEFFFCWETEDLFVRSNNDVCLNFVEDICYCLFFLWLAYTGLCHMFNHVLFLVTSQITRLILKWPCVFFLRCFAVAARMIPGASGNNLFSFIQLFTGPILCLVCFKFWYSNLTGYPYTWDSEFMCNSATLLDMARLIQPKPNLFFC